MTPQDRFWSRVDTSSDCWEWTAGKSNGRGRMRWNGRQTFAYRISWELAHGTPPPADLLVCHHCDNPGCVRPSHLFVGTYEDNNRDMAAKGRARNGVRFGEEHHCAVASDDFVRAARERYAMGGLSPIELARELGVRAETLRNWLRGHDRTEAGGPTFARLAPVASHGTYYLYSRKGCRCEPCRDAGRAYRARRRAVAA